MTGSTDNSKGGIPLGLAAYAIWGVMPLYFKLLAGVQPTEMLNGLKDRITNKVNSTGMDEPHLFGPAAGFRHSEGPPA